MAYYANRKIQYNGRVFLAGQEIPDFGIGKYDDILLESKQVGSDGTGTGVEGRIANLKKVRLEQKKQLEGDMKDESGWKADFAKYGGENDMQEVQDFGPVT